MKNITISEADSADIKEITKLLTKRSVLLLYNYCYYSFFIQGTILSITFSPDGQMYISSEGEGDDGFVLRYRMIER